MVGRVLGSLVGGRAREARAVHELLGPLQRLEQHGVFRLCAAQLVLQHGHFVAKDGQGGGGRVLSDACFFHGAAPLLLG